MELASLTSDQIDTFHIEEAVHYTTAILRDRRASDKAEDRQWADAYTDHVIHTCNFLSGQPACGDAVLAVAGLIRDPLEGLIRETSIGPGDKDAAQQALAKLGQFYTDLTTLLASRTVVLSVPA